MKTTSVDQINWSPCTYCSGRGKVPPKAHKKKGLAQGTQPAESLVVIRPSQYINICTNCGGSGLITSDSVHAIEPNYPHVAIIGAGIGGVALAVACKHRGIPFTLYERDENFNSRSQGYGLTLQQASNAIAGLGITELQNGITSNRHLVHESDGTIIGEWGMRKHLGTNVPENSKRKNVHISRQSLRAQLITQLGGEDMITWEHKLTELKSDDDCVPELHFETPEGDKIVRADLVIGADGIRSVVRAQVINEAVTPLRYLGCIVILGICSLRDISKENLDLLDGKTVFQTVNGSERIYMMPYDEENVMWQLSFPIDESEALTLSSNGSEALQKEALSRLRSWHQPIESILQTTKPHLVTGYPVYDRKMLSPELLSNLGNFSLIGDAAHPMSPFKGQGANQALLDALALAREIQLACTDQEAWRKDGIRKIVLEQFEVDMLERVRSKVEASARAVEVLHSDAALRKDNNPRSRSIA